LSSFAPASEAKSFPLALLEDLSCPCCGSRFAVVQEVHSLHGGIRDGVLRCDCYEYPVVCGIPILRQLGLVSSTRNEAVELLKRRDPTRALRWLFENAGAVGVLAPSATSRGSAGKSIVSRWLLGQVRHKGWSRFEGSPGGFKSALQESRPRGYADYLYYRPAYPSLLGAIPPLVVLGDSCRKSSRRRVIDLLCGVGHASAILDALYPELETIAADIDFVNLYLSQRFVAPRSAAICLDAELPLPFADASLDAFFCLDGLHYVRSKVALLREVDRVLTAEGIWVFAHMHNAAGQNVNAGAPLSAKEYSRRFAFGQHRMLSKLDVLQQYQTSGCLDLVSQPDTASVESSNALILMGARTEDLWTRHSGLEDALRRRPDLLGFNPIYRVEEATDGLTLTSAYPSESLRQECVGKTPILPDEVHIPARVLKEIREMISLGALSGDLRMLLRSFVIIPLPNCYPRPSCSVNS